MNLYYIQADSNTFIRHIHDVEPTRWNENTFCLARKLTPEQVKQFGVHQLKLVTPPYYDPATQTREHGPALLIEDVWTQNYIVTDLDADALAATVDAQWGIIRAERNKLLVASDWTQLPDTSADAAAWAVYRQALRDITDQANPFAIVWPESPST